MTRSAGENGQCAGRREQQPHYVVASCQAWHRPLFERLATSLPGHWHWVGEPAELDLYAGRDDVRYIFFLHWSWRVAPSLWQSCECVCFHMTDVPYGRGGSPLQNLILAGQSQTRLSALRMVEELDAGPVYAKRELLLHGRAEDIYRRAGQLAGDLIAWIVNSEPDPVPQQGEPTIFQRRVPAQSRLPEQGSLQQLYDHIRMLDAPGYPLAFLEYGEFRLEFDHANVDGEALQARVTIRKKHPQDDA